MNEFVMPVLTILIVLGAVLGVATGLIWAERRLLALWEGRDRSDPGGARGVVSDVP
jgi:hypothetical protein